ncbi:uncharacterized protein J7T54_008386 [Emericellopsis cladophorae]|uniref:Carboxylic ester hydrolase n=1 Tax=Emericellopsis cladophorae TaxID=2686198 RepID=A0A9Q0BF43_9HYPO|nr:uncharacterized protein J7T54_008386 [Emericellopsis cladophorae]KAI6782300.1 hypothetical protein J7T54_008386 [Emericellopsis cladophorae]
MAQERPTVKLPQGIVQGVTLRNNHLPRPVEAFRGVPYALPPTGDRRFRQAQPVVPNPDLVIDASAYGPAAPGKQLLAGGPKLEYSEDCLHANVFRHVPAGEEAETKREKKLLPVAVYFHGGAFNRGTSSGHDTASMVAFSEEPFIAVSFNYRLGALGFLPSTASEKEGILNLGLRDQLVLLEWVRDNMHHFGGDKDSVTLFGLSAGAHSIGHLIMHYKEGEKPLFHRAIIESGAATSRAVRPYNAPIHEQQFQEFLKQTKMPADTPPEGIFPFLRSLSTDAISAAQTATFDKYNPSLRWAFQPVIDGDIIPRPPLETWRSGKWHKVPIMTGFTRNEGSLYVNKRLDDPALFPKFFAELLPLLSEEDIATIDRIYADPSLHPGSPYKETRDKVGSQYRRIEQAYAHYAYVAPVRQTAEFASPSAPVYVYQWALEATVLEGARHGDNMRYEFCGPLVVAISEGQRRLARTMHGYVTSFIIAGDPNAVPTSGLERPAWPRYEVGRAKAMVFGEKDKSLVGGASGPAAEVQDDSWERDKCEFWWSKVELSQQ